MSPRRERHHRRRGRWAVLVVVVLIGAAVVVDRTHPHGVDLTHPLGRNRDRRPAGGDHVAATATTTLTRRSLSARTSVDGTLGYAGEYVIAGQLHGTITWLPAVGQVIRQGQVLYRVDGAPVILLYGSTPAYRELAEGANASDVTGTDIAQLNRDLVALGYGRDADLDPSSNEFGWGAVLGDLRGAPNVCYYAAAARAGRLDSLPPVYVDVGSAEILRAESVEFADRIWASGGAAELHVWLGAYHGFDVIAPTSGVSKAAAAMRLRWLERLLRAAEVS